MREKVHSGQYGYKEYLERERAELYSPPPSYQQQPKKEINEEVGANTFAVIKVLFLFFTAPFWLPLYLIFKVGSFLMGPMGGGSRDRNW